MIVLVASEAWFFPFQVDWHTLAYATTDGKGFSYRDMKRIHLFYAAALSDRAGCGDSLLAILGTHALNHAENRSPARLRIVYHLH